MKSSKPKNELPIADKQLSRKQVADLLGVSNETIKRYTRKGIFNPAYLNQRLVRYSYSEVMNFINSNRVTPV